MPKQKRTYQESKEAQAFIRWCHLYPELGDFIFHIPNEGHRTLFQNVRLLSEGLFPGVPDYFYFVPSLGFHGLFIELKSKTGILSVEQRSFALKALRNGYQFKVCRGWIEAANALIVYRPDLKIPNIS